MHAVWHFAEQYASKNFLLQHINSATFPEINLCQHWPQENVTVVSDSNNMVIYVVSEKILCSEVACKNGASCNDTDTGYICDCVAGFTGSLCETGKYDRVPRSLDDA